LRKSLCTVLIVTALATGGCTWQEFTPNHETTTPTTTIAPLGKLLFEAEPTTTVTVNTTVNTAALLPPSVTTTAPVPTPPPFDHQEIAAWEPYEMVTSSSVSFMAEVTRITCNTGTTGKVFPPSVTYSEFEIIVTFMRERTADQAQARTCIATRPQTSLPQWQAQ
jgi:hypothetical protein